MQDRQSKLPRQLLLAATAFALASAAALTPAAHAAGDGDRSLLALGDSVAFGYIAQDGYAYRNAGNFIGYPAYLGARLELRAVNAACKGETTGSFISGTPPDEGCQDYRASYPLHVPYGGSQLAFATAYLVSHPYTQMVTVGLGANDLLMLQDSCLGVVSCIEAGLPAVLNNAGKNMDAILRALRATGYGGPLVVVNYYSPDYTDPLQTGALVALNQVLASIAAAHGATIADAFTAFETAAASSFAGGKTCMTGLLNASPGNAALCDKHPSQTGQQLLAQAVEGAVGYGGH